MITGIILTIIFISGLLSFFFIGKLFYNRNIDDIILIEEDSLVDFEIETFKDESKGEIIDHEISEPKKKRGRKPKAK